MFGVVYKLKISLFWILLNSFIGSEVVVFCIYYVLDLKLGNVLIELFGLYCIVLFGKMVLLIVIVILVLLFLIWYVKLSCVGLVNVLVIDLVVLFLKWIF